MYPANSIYGMSYESSFRSYVKGWLAGVGYVMSLLLLGIQFIYLANNMPYKMDNIIIFSQSLYYFLFNRLLIANPAAQYYYGFTWIHLNFYPNYFQPRLDLSEPTLAPYALYNLDANIIRNAGSSLSVLVTFCVGWVVICGLVYVLDKYLGRKELWYYSIAKNSMLGMIELLSYNIFYWSIAFINYDVNYSQSGTFIGLSVLLLTTLIIYTLARLKFNHIAGIYMIKRLLYACVLASSYQRVEYVVIMIVLEGVFGVVRSLVEKPREKWMLIGLWIE